MIQVFNQYVSAKSFVLMVVEASLIVLSLICAVEVRFLNNPAEVLVYLSLPYFAAQTSGFVFWRGGVLVLQHPCGGLTLPLFAGFRGSNYSCRFRVPGLFLLQRSV